MPYITVAQSPVYHQITFEEIISGVVNMHNMISSNESNTRTYFSRFLTQKFLDRFDFDDMITSLEAFNDQNKTLFDVQREKLYTTFHIPKKSGGLREINAPVPELMTALRNLKTLFETKMFAKYHTSAFAYVPGRSPVDAIKRHQKNGSHWFLKTDFSNFFGSTTPEFLRYSLSLIFPFSEIVKSPRGRDALDRALSLCFLHGGLPQGTPISPMLTNLMMIPIDHKVSNALRDFHGQSFVYTRYADDCQISSRKDFDYNQVIEFINQTLREFRAPFKIKEEKTRYGSRAGSNWNLGLMLNKDNKITIGHKNKQRFRAMISNYILDRKNGIAWDLHDIQVLSGHINYYRMVESDYVDEVIRFNNEKYRTDVMRSIREDLAS